MWSPWRRQQRALAQQQRPRTHQCCPGRPQPQTWRWWWPPRWWHPERRARSRLAWRRSWGGCWQRRRQQAGGWRRRQRNELQRPDGSPDHAGWSACRLQGALPHVWMSRLPPALARRTRARRTPATVIADGRSDAVRAGRVLGERPGQREVKLGRLPTPRSAGARLSRSSDDDHCRRSAMGRPAGLQSRAPRLLEPPQSVPTPPPCKRPYDYCTAPAASPSDLAQRCKRCSAVQPPADFT